MPKHVVQRKYTLELKLFLKKRGQGKLYTIQDMCTNYTVYRDGSGPVHYVRYTVYNVHYTVHNIHYIVYSILFSVQYTVYSVQYKKYTVYSIQCTLYSI